MCRQRDARHQLLNLIQGFILLVEPANILWGRFIVPQVIQNANKGFVLLPENLVQLQIHHPRLLQSFGFKKVHGVVKSAQNSPFFVLDHRRQLVQIPNQQHLNSPKWNLIVALHTSHAVIDRIQNISTQHADFINHQQVNGFKHLSSELV